MAKKQLALFQEGDDPETIQTLVAAGSSGRLVTGREKLGQRVSLELLTEAGSLRFLEGAGTEFPGALRRSHFLSETDLIAAFNLAALQIVTRLQGEDTDDDPDDERLAAARLDQLEVGDGVLTLTAAVVSRAGTGSVVTLPVEYTPEQPGARFVAD